MKKKWWTSFMVSILFFSLAAGCSLDLSHKHYPDSYGYCKSCQTDLCVTIEQGLDGIYDSGEIALIPYNDVYVKFNVAEDSPATIQVLKVGSVELGSTTLYSTNASLISSTWGETPLQYSNTLSTTTTYYLRIQATGSGAVRVRITPQA